MRQLPEHGPCFVCGTENPCSIGIQWYVREDGSIYGEILLTKQQQGPPGLSHGGATAALLDEAMGAAVWNAGYQVAATDLLVHYRRPVPLGTKIKVIAWVVGDDGKVKNTSGEIHLSNGEVAVTAQGVYKEAKHLFTKLNVEDHKT